MKTSPHFILWFYWGIFILRFWWGLSAVELINMSRLTLEDSKLKPQLQNKMLQSETCTHGVSVGHALHPASHKVQLCVWCVFSSPLWGRLVTWNFRQTVTSSISMPEKPWTPKTIKNIKHSTNSTWFVPFNPTQGFPVNNCSINHQNPEKHTQWGEIIPNVGIRSH